MKRVSCSLVVLGLFLRVAGRADAEFTYTTLDVPGSALTQANGINDAGQIVGYYEDASGREHGFLAVPEPSTFTLFGIGTLGYARCRWRRDAL
jgi:probable HAF family extracellular repeat protein